MPKISDNLVQLHKRIESSARECGRAPKEILLVAVSKTKPASDIAEAFRAGQRDFGENYVQEALEKCLELAELGLTWHFIGPLQSNKTRAIAEHFHWVHSVDRLKIAQRLSEQRPIHLPTLNVCLQVNIDNQSTKAGCLPEEAIPLAKAIAALPNLRLRGLMAIPALKSGRAPFLALAQLRQQINQSLQQINRETPMNLDTLSMGMSDDLDEAIAAGSTMIRVGTAIFGSRPSFAD